VRETILIRVWRWKELRQISRTIKAIIEDRLGEVHTALPAKIKSYDAETMYAEVILLNKKQLGY